MKFTWRDGDRTRVVELSPSGNGRYVANVDGAEIELSAESLGPGDLRVTGPGGIAKVQVTRAGDRRFVRFGSLDFVIERVAEGARRRRGGGGGLDAPMPGTVTQVMVAAGDQVTKGQPLVALEAMKMEHVIRAPRDGVVKSVAVAVGEMVNGGVDVVEMDGEAES